MAQVISKEAGRKFGDPSVETLWDVTFDKEGQYPDTVSVIALTQMDALRFALRHVAKHGELPGTDYSGPSPSVVAREASAETGTFRL